MCSCSLATPEGTQRYADRLRGTAHPEHFRTVEGLRLSSIGLGSYLGECDDATDRRYEDAVAAAVSRGCNLIDTAINYRFQRSERAIGRALRRLFDEKKAERDEIFVSTKAGFIPFDGGMPADPRKYFHAEFVKPGVAGFQDLVAGMHCMTPKYLEHQLDASRKNLGLESIDLFYVHNPETQLGEIPRDEFMKRLRAAFEMLEGKAKGGAIRWYGTATWTGYRSPPGAPDHLSLEAIVAVAREAGGDGHHFRGIQLPYNLAMVEAAFADNQRAGGKDVSPAKAAAHFGLMVCASASILQGQLARRLPDVIENGFPELKTNAQKALQFARSTPGLTTALVGMSRVAHVEENLELAKLPPADLSTILQME